MSAVFFSLTVIAMVAVLGALVLGVFSMAKGGEFARKYGNKLMQARVWLQGAALVLFAIALMTVKK
jgi:hypothetical protein